MIAVPPPCNHMKGIIKARDCNMSLYDHNIGPDVLENNALVAEDKLKISLNRPRDLFRT